MWKWAQSWRGVFNKLITNSTSCVPYVSHVCFQDNYNGFFLPFCFSHLSNLSAFYSQSHILHYLHAPSLPPICSLHSPLSNKGWNGSREAGDIIHLLKTEGFLKCKADICARVLTFSSTWAKEKELWSGRGSGGLHKYVGLKEGMGENSGRELSVREDERQSEGETRGDAYTSWTIMWAFCFSASCCL